MGGCGGGWFGMILTFPHPKIPLKQGLTPLPAPNPPPIPWIGIRLNPPLGATSHGIKWGFSYVK